MNPHYNYEIINNSNSNTHCNNHLCSYECNKHQNNTYNYWENLKDFPPSSSSAGRHDENSPNRFYNISDNNHGYNKSRAGRYSSYDGRNFNSYYNSIILSSSCEDVSRTGTGAAMTPRCKYSIRLKLEVIEYSQKFSIHKTARQFRIDRKTVRDWRAQESQLRRRLKLEKIDDGVLRFYQSRQEKKSLVSQEELKVKAMEIFRQLVQEGGTVGTEQEFEANEDWLRKFMKRYKLNVDQGSTPLQKTPGEYVDEFLEYFIDKQKLPASNQTKKHTKELENKNQNRKFEMI